MSPLPEALVKPTTGIDSGSFDDVDPGFGFLGFPLTFDMSASSVINLSISEDNAFALFTEALLTVSPLPEALLNPTTCVCSDTKLTLFSHVLSESIVFSTSIVRSSALFNAALLMVMPLPDAL